MGSTGEQRGERTGEDRRGESMEAERIVEEGRSVDGRREKVGR